MQRLSCALCIHDADALRELRLEGVYVHIRRHFRHKPVNQRQVLLDTPQIGKLFFQLFNISTV